MHDGRMSLLGRDDELTRIQELLSAARHGRGGALLITGDPGIGKSSLLRATTRASAPARVLGVDGIEAESSIPFGSIHRLLIPLREYAAALPERHREALAIASGVAVGPPPEQFLVGLGVLGLVAAAAAERPLVCVVDDAHVLDAESIAVLAFVARRLEAESVALVMAGRSDGDIETRIAGVPRLELGGLPPEAGVRLLTSSLDATVDPVAAAQIVLATGGNPLALIDLARELTAKQLAESSFALEPLPIGNHLEAHYLRRVRQLSDESQQWLVIAAADSTGNLDIVEAAARALDLPADLGDAAEDAGLVELGDTVRFHHPLVRAAAYNAARGPQRRRVHRALAAASAAAGHVEIEAWHAARATLGFDAEVADRLERVADRAAERGGLGSRARVLQQAAGLTPPGPLRSARLVGAADAAMAAGAAQLARALLDDADEDELDPVSRGRMIATRASISLFVADPDLVNSGAAMLEAADAFHGHDAGLEQDALIKAFDFTLPPERAAQGTTLQELGRRMAAGAAIRPGVASTILTGLSALILEPYEAAVVPMRRALDALVVLGPDDLLRYGATSVSLATALWDADARRGCLVRTADAARDAGSLHQLDTVLWILALVEAHGGSPRRAAEAMEQVRELRRAHGYDAEHVINVSLLAWSGAPIDQIELIGEAATAMGFDGVRAAGQSGLAARDLSEGRYNDAYQRLQPLIADPFLHVTPLTIPDYVEAAVRSGRADEAAEHTVRLEAIAAANGSPWARGVAHRARALVTDSDAETQFRLSIEELARTIVEAELGRSHLLFGEWLRRNRRRREAKEQLQLARDLFVQIEAPTFAARATSELEALGARVPAPRADAAAREHSLTAQELIVARLAASGHTNAEIAATMFLSTNTIDYHLRKIFQKLGLSSRRQLRESFGAG